MVIVTVAFHPVFPLVADVPVRAATCIVVSAGGGCGAVNVVADAIFEYADDRFTVVLTACTRYV